MSRLTRRGAPSLTANRNGAIFSAIARTAGSAGARGPGRGAKGGGGRGGGGPGVEGGRRQRVEAGETGRRVARRRGQQAPPGEAVGEHPLGAERVAAPPQQLLRAPPGQRRQRGERAVGALEALQRPAL